MSDRGETSVRALIMIILIVCMGLFIVSQCVRWYTDRLARGDDKLMVNTAESVARINSSDGQDCPVNNCPGGDCAHRDGNRWIGYFDNVSNTIVGNKPEGYNEYGSMEAGGKTYYGDTGTMVIRIETGNSVVVLSWEEGEH